MDSSEFDLTFPMLEYGATETPWDLRPLLFRGGAAAKVKHVGRQIAQSELGSPLPERFELVTRLHEHMTDDLAGGGSRFSVQNKISALRRFFAWIDSENVNLSLETAADTFIRWTDHLLQRHRVERNFSEGSLYDLTRLTATMLDRALDRQASLSKSTRIRKPRGKGKVHTSKADKQSLQNTFAFGHLLADVCEALTWRGTMAPLPVCISLRTGQVLELWSGLQSPEKVAARRTRPQNQAQIEASLAARAAHDADRTLRTRFPIVNLRIESELLMFIAQTGMNLQQAHTLRVEQFHYTSHLDGYQVRTYKNDGKEKCYSRFLPVIESGSSAISNGVPNGFPMSRMVCSFRLYVAGTNPRRGDAVHERYAHLPRAWHTDSETAKTARDAHQLVASGVPESPTGCGVGPAYGANADTRICRPPSADRYGGNYALPSANRSVPFTSCSW
ncbi:hypothetical protein ACOAL9_14355 [Pseudomonas aeruginosa]|uniref:hypothetical protein n=1 Tax=Pseudomonas aeruginosa TaxID=287 RepID=UPI003B28DAD0